MNRVEQKMLGAPQGDASLLGRIIISGDRNWTGPELEARFRVFFRSIPAGIQILHGGCKGVDMTAEMIAREFKIPTQIFLPDWDKYGKGGGPVRNKEMLKTGVIGVYLFHRDLANSKGTKNMAIQAKAAGVPTYLIT